MAVCKSAYQTVKVTMLQYLSYMVVSIIWLLLTLLDAIEIVKKQSAPTEVVRTARFKDRSTWAKMVAHVIFSIPLLILYSHNFRLGSFCLMNKNAFICRTNWESLAPEIDCLVLGRQPNSSVQSFFDNVGGFLDVGHDFNKPKFHLLPPLFHLV